MSNHDDPLFFERLGRLGPSLLLALDALETAKRRLHPPDLEGLRAGLEPIRSGLVESLEPFAATPFPESTRNFREQLVASARTTREALDRFLAGDAGPAGLLEAMHLHCRAQRELYPLRRILPPIDRFFVEPALREGWKEEDPPPDVKGGLHRAGKPPPARGGFSLYVPESYDGASDWPLVVALHGGNGDGSDFLWTWLAEARGRRFLLLAPTSAGDTWSMMGPDVDADAILSMVAYVREHWRVDAGRILLTGLSDGATYTLLLGLRPDSPFTALAPISGVFHPTNLENGNLERARARRIYLVHGALDWLFPVFLARGARDALTEAGAELLYREIADLSHTYPREENDAILSWFDPDLSLPRS